MLCDREYTDLYFEYLVTVCYVIVNTLTYFEYLVTVCYMIVIVNTLTYFEYLVTVCYVIVNDDNVQRLVVVKPVISISGI
jgi:hypothetical protein